MFGTTSLNQESLPDSEWVAYTYNIQWTGQSQVLGGQLAKVFLFNEESTNRRLVMRLSNPEYIGGSRLGQVHRFLEYLSERGVRTPIPLRTCEGQTYAVHEASGKLVEIFPYINGHSPQKGNVEDARQVAVALAKFHNAGVLYEDLPGEENGNLHHLALERLRMDVKEARVFSVGKIFEKLLYDYLVDGETLIDSLQKLRPGLVETGLHQDASPNNIIFTEDGEVWFIDCSHTVRGRRVFDVVTAVYYIDLSSRVPMPSRDSDRYEDLDPELESAFLKAYRSVCEPEWQEAETDAYALENRLMLIHAAAYWATNYSDEYVMRELAGFRRMLKKW